MNNAVGIVWNPSKTSKGELRDAIAEALKRTAPRELLWFETTRDDPGRAATAAAVAQGCSLVIAAGGDGTARAVAEYLGESGSPKAALGIVPLGTGNLLARNLKVPLGDPTAAFTVALESAGIPLDLGWVSYTSADGTDREAGFVVMAGFGLDAQMIVETDDELKARAGWLAYVESLGRAAAGTEVVDLTITLDDGPATNASAHTLLIANCGTLQAGVTLLPDALPDDGELDLLLLSADGVAGWLDTARNMVWDNGLKRLLTKSTNAESSDSAHHDRAKYVRVALPSPLDFELDGDGVGPVSQIEVSVLPGALQVAVSGR